MDYKVGKRYLISTNNDTDRCICTFVEKSGELFKFKVIGSNSSYDKSKYNINTIHKNGKILKFDYDEIIDYDDPVLVYLIDSS